MSFNFADIWAHMGVPAMIIAGVLMTMGLASLTVFVERIFALRRSRHASRLFAGAVGADVKAARLEAIIARASEPAYKHAHLAHIVRSALQAYQHALETIDIGGLPPGERSRRHLERFMEEVGADLRRGTNVLASVGSTAPFIGLLGTVVGIISAFQGIAATGSGGLSAVSAGISEALIETALGLAVAIPAVLVFNYLSNMIAREELLLQHSAGELLDTIDDWEERRAAAPASGSPERRVVAEPTTAKPVRLEAALAGARA
ncbi:MAG TPA: MotA/TolQ/ExbB proton channel family protein [Candidatus Dormibacteraeota bacterium]|nr:MotA/TolQ/ExbB proton channel family protein [Candidatus Dormibacteraeota bacterium]